MTARAALTVIAGQTVTIPNGDVVITDTPRRDITSNDSIVLNDRGGFLYFTNSGYSVTIPSDATLFFPIGSTIVFVNLTGGNVNVVTGSGNRVFGTSGQKDYVLANNNVATIKKVGSNLWVLYGNGVS